MGYRGSALKFEWDPIKSKKTQEVRGLTFDHAIELWSDPDAIELATHTLEESRFLKIGKRKDQKIYTAVFTLRVDLIRIISFRRSQTKEELKYEQSKNNS